MSKHATKPEGKAEGLSFWHCFKKAKLYSRDVPGILPYLYILPFTLAYPVLDFTLRYTYRSVGIVGVTYLPAALFTIGWTLVFAGLVFALPGIPQWFLRCVPLVTFVTICVTHSGFMSMFGKFFAFSVLSFGGTGSFFEADYIHIDWRVVLGATITVLLMMTAGRLLTVIPPKPVKKSILAGLAAFLVGVGLVSYTDHHYFPTVDTVIWANDSEDAAAAVYQNFSDRTNTLMVCGLYQYSIRDLWLTLFPPGAMSQEERAQVEQYVSEYEAAKKDNAYTGRYTGKNLILVQLEAIDTWMLDPDYMPRLSALKERSIVFANHFTPAYITAGTFNTEFMTNTSLLPATGGIPTSVYVQDKFPYSMANLFTRAGYTARTFHNSDGSVYDRGVIHPNLGYESYNGGDVLQMPDIHLDRYLMNGFEAMTQGDPFYSFVITYSGHGPYSDDNSIYVANQTMAQKAAKIREGSSVYAIAGAMETDRFVGELVDALEEKGLLQDTVLAFYADHYNYYMMDDALNMKIKEVENLNLLTHTDFFIWSAEQQEQTVVEKVTASVDVLPTLANLFGLDTTGAFFAGHDGLGEEGGYVFFDDGSAFDGAYYNSAAGPTPYTNQAAALISLSNRVLGGNYYKDLPLLQGGTQGGSP